MSERTLVELTIPGSAAWVCLVRRWVADALMVAGHRDVDGARLVASELAGNAVLHTASGRPGGLVRVKVFGVTDVLARIEVIDEGAATVPRSRRPGDDECGGRGLWLVEQTAIRWGTRSVPRRWNLAWAEVSTLGVLPTSEFEGAEEFLR
ncbi:ATP-binding protein [Nonomuraea sp. MCN248]|uniref:ATP-binding protein n=1 Tax=Nonomuraea corallina TaxID=2989783 RepID=A0ABT4S563_9ACTN|nr:ATP-binding protein [Nonomuraea corallina]MDA0632339.1 ATP-binding protein [Nonomuraea corallina]